MRDGIYNTERQLEVLRAFFRREARRPASYQEVCEDVGFALRALERHVRILEKRGLISRSPKRHRSVRLTRAGIAALEGRASA